MSNDKTLNGREIQDWLITYISELSHVAPETIDIREPFSNYGLSSRDAVTLSGDLEEILGCRLSPTLAYEYPSIELLSNHLAGNNETTAHSELQNKLSETNEPVAIIGIDRSLSNS